MRTALVVTHHWVPNFGANLQAWATARLLSARGYRPLFVDFRPVELVEKYLREVSAEQRAAHDTFVSEHLEQTARLHSHATFQAMVPELGADVAITGSDAVFRLAAGTSRADLVFPNPYWPTDIGIPAIAFAPSAMGSRFDRLSRYTLDGAGAALDGMAAVSARDAWTERQLRLTGYRGPITRVSDPVMTLLDEVAADCAVVPRGRPYIVLSTQGRASPRWTEKFTALAEANGFDTLAIPTPDGAIDANVSRRVNLPLSPRAWMRLIGCSSGYVGVRFHPVVVATLGGVPVFSFDLYHWGPHDRSRSKTWLLLKEFKSERYVSARRLHRLVTPNRVWRALESQMSDKSVAGRRAVAETLAATTRAFLDDALDAA